MQETATVLNCIRCRVLFVLQSEMKRGPLQKLVKLYDRQLLRRILANLPHLQD